MPTTFITSRVEAQGKIKSYHTIIHLHLQLVWLMQTLKAFPHTALMFNNPDVVFGFGFFDEGLISQF